MPNSHLGQLVTNHVTLSGFGMGQNDLGEEIYGFGRIYPDGTAGPHDGPFKVPAGNVLVVTDVDWTYNTGYRISIQTFNIFMLMPETNIRNKVFASTVMGDNSGRGGASVSMTTGFVVSKMDRMRLNLTSPGYLDDIILRGYLVDVPEIVGPNDVESEIIDKEKRNKNNPGERKAKLKDRRSVVRSLS